MPIALMKMHSELKKQLFYKVVFIVTQLITKDLGLFKLASYISIHTILTGTTYEKSALALILVVFRRW